MKYQHLSNLLLKISGLLIIIVTAINIPNYFVNYYSLQNFYGNQIGNLTTIIVAVAIPLAITLLLALALFIFPNKISNSLILDSSENNEIDIEKIPSVAFMAIGMYFVAFALADCVYWVAYYSFMEVPVTGTEYFEAENKAQVVTTIAELLIGLVLLFGSKGIGKFVIKARTAGLKETSNK